MGRNRNLYVSDRDEDLYEWIKQYAYEHRMSTSAAMMLAVEKFREQVGQDAEKDP